jgi:hypothetical protein
LYFKKEYRKRRENESYSISDFIDLVFQDIYISNRNKCLLKINIPIEHPLLNYIIKSENSQNQNPNAEIKKNLAVYNSLVNISHKENEKSSLENNKSQIKNKISIINFTIEKKYRNNNQRNLNKSSSFKKEENKELRKQKKKENNQQYESKNSEENTGIKNTENSISETKEFLANLDPILNTSIYSNNENLISHLKKKSKFSNFKRLGLNRTLFENKNKAFFDSNNSNNYSDHNNQSDFSNRNRKKIVNLSNPSQKNFCCDEIFYEYLNSITKYANQKYFVFVFKFIIIFRECINTYKNIELENSILILKEFIPLEIKEFTQYYDAEQAPELCNEFISEYLQSCDYFGFDKNEIPEIIDIIQHFCYWMYENNYTSSRLSLLNMN